KWLPVVLQGRREVSLVLPRENWNMTKDLARPLHDVTRGSKVGLKARARRIELQKYRALQSFFEAKARRQHKIKSKTYHRIQKRGRMKDESKQLEKLVNSNDQSAVDKHFQLLDIARIKERITLRHKNTGKWAKAQALIAKYDPKARAELHEQLMRSKELNRKRLTTTLLDDGSDDEIQSVDEEAKPCNIGSLTNPWMHMSVQLESCATLVGKDKKKEGSEVAEDMKDNEEVVKIDDDNDEDAFENEQTLCKVGSSPRLSQEGQKVFSKEPGNDFEGTEYCEVLFSSCDKNLDASETISKNDGIKPTMKLSKQIGKQNQTINNEVQSKMGKRKRKKCKNKMKSEAKNSTKMSVKSDEHVCLKKREENMWEEQKSQRALILEAFSGDDVVGDFSKEKNAKVLSEAPQVKDYTLPGWGEWSGVGIAPNPRKRHSCTSGGGPRKDRSLPHIILSEKRNAALAQHQVLKVPYPFNTAADFEQSLHGPLSTTWIPSQAARLLNQPRVHTQMGAIIKPISAEEIFGDAGRHGH
uniref:Uncharacterized protein n=1 Tax=Eptatretus burgeri TaxID=7764 RepID=A0A8C4PY10_EPTBU